MEISVLGEKKRKRKERKRRRKRRRKRKGQRGGGEGERGEGGILACVPQVDSRKFPHLLKLDLAVALAAAAVERKEAGGGKGREGEGGRDFFENHTIVSKTPQMC